MINFKGLGVKIMGIEIGDNNKIKKSNIIENADIKVELKEKPKKGMGMFKQIFVNVMSNFLWKILSILISLGLFIALCMLANNH